MDIVTNPYVGPRTFEPGEAELFFGREREAKDLFSLVLSDHLVLFYAQSGAGKSSLINTRLKPKCEKQGFEVMTVARVSGRPPEGVQADNIYMFNLLTSLDEGEHKPADLASLTLKDYLARLRLKEDTTGVGRDTRWIVMIDQFEEIFTTNLEHWEKREDFFKQLGDALDADARLWMVLTIREDYVALLDSFTRYLPDRLSTRYYMRRLGVQAALEAIERPAEKGGRPFLPGVAQILVDNLRQFRLQEQDTKPYPGEFIEPVQLQVVCYRFWEKLNEKPLGPITEQDLEELGNVDQALADFYEHTLAEVLTDEGVKAKRVSEPELRNWIKRKLITESGTRGMVFRGPERTGGIPNEVVDLLSRKLLLRAEVKPGGRWYELSHDRLIPPILAANNAWELERPLLVAARAWEAAGYPDNRLLEGQTLQTALESDWQSLGQVVKEFLDASQQAQAERESRERERLEEQERKLEAERQKAELLHQRAEEQAKFSRRLTIAAGIAGVLAIAAIWFGIQSGLARQDALNQKNTAEAASTLANEQVLIAQAFQNQAATAQVVAEDQRDRASTAQADAEIAQATAEGAQAEALNQANLARSRELANLSNQADDPGLSLLLAIEAVQVSHSSEAQVALSVSISRLDDVSRLIRSLNLEEGVYEAVWSQDEFRILTASFDGTARVWDTQTGEELLQLPHEDAVWQAVWNRDDSQILTISIDGTARVWDAQTGEELLRLTHTDYVYRAMWNQDESRILTTSYDGTARVWDAQTGEELLRLTHTDYVYRAMWNQDESRILTASYDGTARVWDAQTGEELLQLTHEDGVFQAKWNQEETQILTASFDGTARVWDAQTGEELPRLTHTDYVYRAIWNQDESQILTASLDGTARVWDAQTGQELLQLTHGDGVWQAVWNKEETQILTASFDGTARVWDAQTGEELLRVTHADRVYGAVWNKEETQILTASQDGTARIWNADLTLDETLPRFSGHTAPVRQMSWNSEGTQLLTVSEDGTARVWDSITGEEILQLDHRGQKSDTVTVYQAVWNRAENQILTASSRGVWIWDAKTGKQLRGPKYEEEVFSAVWNSDESLILTASSDGTAQIWDANTGDELHTLTHDGPVYQAIWSQTGDQVVTASSDGTVGVWDAQTGEDLYHFEIGSPVRQILLNSDGTRLLTASQDGIARVWEMETRKLIIQLVHQGTVNQFFWIKQGTEILTASADGTAHLWDAVTGDERLRLEPGVPSEPDVEELPVIQVAWHEGRILTVLETGIVQVWDDESGEEWLKFAPPGGVSQALWRGNESYLLLAETNGSIRQFYTDPRNMEKIACLYASRNMSVDEWFRSLGSEKEFQPTCPERGYYPDFIEAARALASRGKIKEALMLLDERPEIDQTRPKLAARLAGAYNQICNRGIFGIPDDKFDIERACQLAVEYAHTSDDVVANLRVCANRGVPSLADIVQDACALAGELVTQSEDVDRNLDICAEGSALNLDDIVKPACDLAIEQALVSSDADINFRVCTDGVASGLAELVSPACKLAVDLAREAGELTQMLDFCTTGLTLGLDEIIFTSACSQAVSLVVATDDVFLNFQACTAGKTTNRPEIFSQTCQRIRELAREIKADSAVRGTIAEAGARELWWFQGIAGQVITIRMNKYQSSLDSVVVLYGPDGAYLIEDDESGGDSNALIFEFTLPEDGSYFLIARGWSDFTGGYQLSIEILP